MSNTVKVPDQTATEMRDFYEDSSHDSPSPTIDSLEQRIAEFQSSSAEGLNDAALYYFLASQTVAEFTNDLRQDVQVALPEGQAVELWASRIREELATYSAHPELLKRELERQSRVFAMDPEVVGWKKYQIASSFLDFYERFATGSEGLRSLQEQGSAAFSNVARLFGGFQDWEKIKRRMG